MDKLLVELSQHWVIGVSYFSLLKRRNPASSSQFVAFGLLLVSAAVLNTRLPETRGVPLPETIEDLLKRSKCVFTCGGHAEGQVELRVVLVRLLVAVLEALKNVKSC